MVPPNVEPWSLDVSLTSASINMSCSPQTMSTLSSDHLPIIIQLQMTATTNQGLRGNYVNLNKANGDIYRQELEAVQRKRSFPTNQSDENIFHTVQFKHRPNEEPVPADTLGMMTRRDSIRKTDLTSPELPILNKYIQNRVCVHKQQKCRGPKGSLPNCR